MDDVVWHGGVAFFTPLAWALLLYPFSKKFGKGLTVFLIAALFLSFVVMIIKELGDQAISRNDIIADMVGLFFGIAALVTVFLSATAATASRFVSSSKQRMPSFFAGTVFRITPSGRITLRELLMAGRHLCDGAGGYYLKMAGVLTDSKAKDLCVWLSRMESEKGKYLFSELDGWLAVPLRPKIMEKARIYLCANNVYTKEFASSASFEEVLKYALYCEGKMQRFFVYYRKSFSEAWKRKKVDGIIRSLAEYKVRLRGVNLKEILTRDFSVEG